MDIVHLALRDYSARMEFTVALLTNYSDLAYYNKPENKQKLKKSNETELRGAIH